jgi:signal transduction histidine kinase
MSELRKESGDDPAKIPRKSNLVAQVSPTPDAELDGKVVESDRAIEEAKALSELKDRFYGAICHQFRSFLNIISLSNSLLRRYIEQQTDSSKVRYVDNIQGAVEQISTLLDKIIFLSPPEVGKVNFNPKETDILNFCRDLTAQMKAIADNKQQTLEFICRDNTCTVWVDADLLEQIATNLLTNAVKYTPEGGKIEFKLVLKDEKLVFQIKDTGIGISLLEQQRIFEPFYRGSNIGDKSGMGLGLGLTIVKNLVHLHDGEIHVESQEKIGTTFTVTIPTKRSPLLQMVDTPDTKTDMEIDL